MKLKTSSTKVIIGITYVKFDKLFGNYNTDISKFKNI